MTKTVHNIYLFFLTGIVFATFILLLMKGFSYYMSPLSERFFHENHESLKPNGIFGHGIGIAGSLALIIGVFGYMVRKRIRKLSRMGYLKYWLELHVFLCSLGPVLIFYHTAFKFGGIVAISFWSMIAVVISGIIGRFIYLQIPRSIEGRELSLNEVKEFRTDLNLKLKSLNIDEDTIRFIDDSINLEDTKNRNIFKRIWESRKNERKAVRRIKSKLKSLGLKKVDYKKVVSLIKKETALNRRIELLVSMQDLLRYWHVAHLPFALIMLVIMIIHVIIALLFGYKWIF